MNQILHCDWLPEWARWSYLARSGLHCTRRVPQEKFLRKPYNKFFIDQACPVKMAGYWPRSFFCEFMDFDSVLVHKLAKKELSQYQAILTSHLVNNPYILPTMHMLFGLSRNLPSSLGKEDCMTSPESVRIGG